MSTVEHPRSIRSFVTRSGRITDAQQRALDELWPKYGVELPEGPLDLDALFGRRAARVVEIGFGNGENVLALASAHPEQDYLGIEVHRAGIGRLLLAVEQARLTNVRVVCHDAVEVLERHLLAESLNEVLILFPDPWPKKRHHKRRLIQPGFVELLASRLAPDGLLRLATDWEPYAMQMRDVLSTCTSFENLAAERDFVERPTERVTTRFERRGERLGHGVWDLAWRRRGRKPASTATD
jgi:tRNA (guanine-N7-)-methyltransferase